MKPTSSVIASERRITQPPQLKRRRFLQTAGAGLAAIGLSPLTGLAQVQESQSLQSQLMDKAPQKTLEAFLELILNDSSVKDHLSTENFTIVSAAFSEEEGLTPLFVKAVSAAYKANIGEERVQNLAKQLDREHFKRVNQGKDARYSSFNTGSPGKIHNLMIVPYGSKTECFNSPMNAVFSMIQDVSTMSHVQQAIKEFKKTNPNKDASEMQPIVYDELTRLQDAKKLAESITRTIKEKHGASEPLLKELQEDVINKFDAEIRRVKAQKQQPKAPGRWDLADTKNNNALRWKHSV